MRPRTPMDAKTATEGEGRGAFRGGERTPRGPGGGRGAGEGLVVHEGDQGADHEGQGVLVHRGQREAQTLAATCQ